MNTTSYAEHDDILRAVGEMALNFAELEQHIEGMLMLLHPHLPEDSEVHRTGPTRGFATKVDMLSKYIPWYHKNILKKVALLNLHGWEVVSFLKDCKTLAQERNKYVHAVLHHWDPTKFVPTPEIPPQPTFDFLAANRRAETTYEPVTIEHLEQMKELSTRIKTAARTALGDHYLPMLTAEARHRSQEIKKLNQT